MSLFRYTLRFSRPGGCPLAVVQDMARFDRATVLSVANDLACEGNNVRGATLLGQREPTMERWATFVVGTRIEKIAGSAEDPFARPGVEGAAIEPKEPRP